MSDESYSFSTARTRLEEIVTQVRKKDTSLETSLDLLEEGVRLANACTELIDHADWTVGGVGDSETSTEDSSEAAQAAEGGVAVEAVDGEHDVIEGAQEAPDETDGAGEEPQDEA